MDHCLIIGAGLVGLSIAYELSQHGFRVRILDRGLPGQEASWAGAGILPPSNVATAVDPLEQLRGISFRLHGEWAARLRNETGIDTGYRRCGGIYLAQSAGEAATLAGFARSLQALDIGVEPLSHAELAACEPALKSLAESGRLRAAWRLPDEAQLRNPWHLQALVEACRQRGVVVESGVEATGVETRGETVTAIQTSQGVRNAQSYCFCAGAWTYGLLERLQIHTGILPIRGQMVLFHADRPPFRHVLNCGSRYLVPRDDGHVLAGSTEEEVGFDKRTTRRAIEELTAFACSLVTDLRHAEVERTWAGLRPGSYDGVPYLGPLPGLQNAYIAAGHFRSGVLLSTGTAVVMGQLIRGETPAIDLRPFRVQRG